MYFLKSHMYKRYLKNDNKGIYLKTVSLHSKLKIPLVIGKKYFFKNRFEKFQNGFSNFETHRKRFLNSEMHRNFFFQIIPKRLEKINVSNFANDFFCFQSSKRFLLVFQSCSV